MQVGIIQLASVSRGLAVDQAAGAVGVEPHNPVPNGLQPDATDPRRFGPGAAIVDLGYRQQPPRSCSLSPVPEAGPHHSLGEGQSLAAWRTSCSPPESLTRSALKTPK